MTGRRRPALLGAVVAGVLAVVRTVVVAGGVARTAYAGSVAAPIV